MFEIGINKENLLENYLLSNSQNVIKEPIFDYIDEGITLANLDGQIVVCNQATLKLHGFNTIEELNGYKALDLISKTDRSQAQKQFADIIANDSFYRDIFTCLKKDGSEFTAEISGSLLKDKNGKPIGIWGITKDISEITSANEQLRLLITALESSSNEVMITDNNGTIIWVNSSFNDITGYKDSEVIGKSPAILKSGKHSDDFYKDMWDTITKGNKWEGEIENKKKNGEIFNEYMKIIPLKNSQNTITHFISLKENITEKKRVEKKLIDSESKYRGIFENSTIGIYRAAKDGKIIVANNRFLEILGVDSVDELENANIENDFYLVPSTRASFFKILDSEGKIYGFESKWKRKDGTIIYLRESATAFRNQSGQIEFYEGTVEDISETILDKKRLLRQSNILKALRFSSEIFLKDLDWTRNIDRVIEKIGKAFDVSGILLFTGNEETEQGITLTRISEWKNTNSTIDIPSKINLGKEGLLHWQSKLLQNDIVSDITENLPLNEKNYLAALGVKSIVLLPILLDDKLWGVMFIHSVNAIIWNSNDIEALRAASDSLKAAIKRKKYEDELVEAKKLAESADKTKSEFLAQISHEIRTPVNNITSFNELLKVELENQIDDDIRVFFDVIDNASKRLIRTIGLILNLSELHTGSYKLVKNNFNLYQDLILVLFQEYNVMAKRKNIDLKLTNNAKQTIVYGDFYSIEQILKNLIDNAIKYTNIGTVELKMDNDKDGQIILSISDTGIGISKDYLPNLFTPFSQEETGYTRKFDGNGIGMTLVKEYCKLNNISIDVISEKNVGTTFTLKFN